MDTREEEVQININPDLIPEAHKCLMAEFCIKYDAFQELDVKALNTVIALMAQDITYLREEIRALRAAHEIFATEVMKDAC